MISKPLIWISWHKESVVFERGYIPTALCRLSLVTLINGRYVHQHGVTGNDPSPDHNFGDPVPHDKLHLQLYSDLHLQLIS